MAYDVKLIDGFAIEADRSELQEILGHKIDDVPAHEIEDCYLCFYNDWARVYTIEVRP